MRWIATLSCTAALLTLDTATANEQPFGTAAEAKALLARAVEALKADPAKALASFNDPEGGFRDRDLYVACAGPGAKVSAHPDKSLIGKDRRQMKDVTGKPFGAEVESVAKDGEIAEVTYMYPRPGTDTTPVAKIAFVTRTGDQVCLVGYYH